MQWAQKQKGFTIVELLIVIVVIAILAAITIVAYNGVQDRAKQSAAAAASTQALKKVAAYAAEHNDIYPDTLEQAGVSGSILGKYQYTVNNNSSPKGFCVTATEDGVSSYLAQNFTYTSSSTQTVHQSAPQAGVCPGHVTSNQTSATNFILNPAVRTVPTGWGALASTGGAPSGGRVTSVSGLSSLGITTAYRNTLGGTPGSWWRVQNDSDVSVTAGDTYTLSGYIRTNVASNTGVIIIWENASGATISESGGSFTASTAGGWARRSVTAVAPAGAVTARFHFGANSAGAATNYIDATAAMFTKGSAVETYADGDSEGWVWNGSSNAASSSGPAL